MHMISISWVRNEADIIEAFVRENAPLLERMYIILHRSEDGTEAILQSLQAEGYPLALDHDQSRIHRQGQALSALLPDVLKRHPEADWVLPLDADEFLRPHAEAAVKVVALPQDSVCLLPWKTYVPPVKPATEQHPFLAMRERRAAEEQQFHKVLIPAALVRNRSVQILPGNHAVCAADGKPLPATPTENLWLAHFPVRSERQLRTKVFSAWLSVCANPDRKPKQSFHWKTLFRRCKQPEPIGPAELRSLALGYAVEDAPEDTAVTEDPITPAAPELQYGQHTADPWVLLAENAEQLACECGKAELSS